MGGTSSFSTPAGGKARTMVPGQSFVQGFLAEHFTPIRKLVGIENMNLLNFPPFSFAAKVYKK